MFEQKVRIRFAKRKMMRFISHLDLMRLFQRALRRAGIDVYITKGFNPHPKISIQPALKLGIESSSMEAVFRLNGWMNLSHLKDRLQEKLPDGIDISETEVI